MGSVCSVLVRYSPSHRAITDMSGLIFFFLYSLTKIFSMICRNHHHDVASPDVIVEPTPNDRARHITLILAIGIFDFAVAFLSNSLYITVSTF